MGRYAILKKEFSFLEVEYGFEANMRQEHGGYYFITWTNGKRNILVLYDDQTDVRKESPVWIRIYDTYCFGTAYDDVDVYREELNIAHGSPKERIRYAANWLREAIERGVVRIE